jgi:uncharacterized membrane protein HdeD (DUF308 family)
LPGPRRLIAWCFLLVGALILFAGIMDSVVGPELQELETGERSPRWYGLINIVIGLALGWYGHRLTQDKDPE